MTQGVFFSALVGSDRENLRRPDDSETIYLVKKIVCSGKLLAAS
ncbi:hypothetical protein [Pseudochrobactrum sp. HB0163]